MSKESTPTSVAADATMTQDSRLPAVTGRNEALGTEMENAKFKVQNGQRLRAVDLHFSFCITGHSTLAGSAYSACLAVQIIGLTPGG